jgi:hypothetical protein
MNRTDLPPEDRPYAAFHGRCLTALVLFCSLTLGLVVMNCGHSPLILVTGLFLTHIVAHISMVVLAGICLQFLLDRIVQMLGDLD